MSDSAALTSTTIADYNAVARQFWAGTRDHDVSQNRDALLRAIDGEAPLRLLDFGCGPGRDLIAFRDLGHHPVGLEGAPDMAALARKNADCDVWVQDFIALDLPTAEFDGVFANASLFHVPEVDLPRVLSELHDTLIPGGVLFCSNPRGSNEAVWSGARWCVFHDLEGWRRHMTSAGFSEIEHYYRPPGKPRDQQPWLASVWRRS